jgi:hypothetical protein
MYYDCAVVLCPVDCAVVLCYVLWVLCYGSIGKAQMDCAVVLWFNRKGANGLCYGLCSIGKARMDCAMDYAQ